MYASLSLVASLKSIPFSPKDVLARQPMECIWEGQKGDGCGAMLVLLQRDSVRRAKEPVEEGQRVEEENAHFTMREKSRY